MQDTTFSVFESFVPHLVDNKAKRFDRMNNKTHFPSTSTTNVTTPEDSSDENSDNGKNIETNDDIRYQIQNEGANNFEFDVKPKQKKYNTPEEYKKKYKTELCKNFTLKGVCKFGTKCSFAHGEHELREKIHLHTNYKTKKCKQFHQSGYCFYGYRCQYLHNEPCELKGLSEKWSHVSRYMRSTLNCGTEEHEMLSTEQNLQPYTPIHNDEITQHGDNIISMVEGLERLIEKQTHDPNIPILHLLNCALRVRLPLFHNFTNEQAINGSCAKEAIRKASSL